MPADVMSLAPRRQSRQPVGSRLPTLAAALVVLAGCGDSGAPLPTAALPQVEVGELLTARELRRSVVSQPLYEARATLPVEPTASISFVETYHEPALLGLEAAGDDQTSEPTLFFQAPQLNLTPTDVTPGDEAPFDKALASKAAANEQPPLPSDPKFTNDEQTASDDAEDADDDWADAWTDWPQNEADELGGELTLDPLPKNKSVAGTPPAPMVALVQELPPAPVELPRPHFFSAPIPLGGVDAQLPHVAAAPAAQQDAIEHELFAEGLFVDVPAAEEIGRLMTGPIREGFALGRAGAVFAARARFEETLRQIAAAKDAAIADDKHTRALADGLLALDEAQHFLPQGDDPIDVAATARGHRTPVLAGDRYERTLPQQAIARYHLHAAKRLADAVAGEQAGSMALFGLGKAYTRLAGLSDDPLARRHGLTMYRAAILAHGDNHLAANELGVGLAAAGHFRAARRALERAAARGGGSTVHRNLAMVHRRLAEPQLALASDQQAERMAARERQTGAISKQLGVQWVSPDRFSRTGGGSPRTARAKTPRSAGRAAPIPGVGAQQAPPVKSQTIIR